MQYVQTNASISIDIGMEHIRDKPHCGWLVRVIFCELQGQLERTPIPRGIIRSENDSVPEHDVVFLGGTTDAGRGVMLEAFEVTHEAFTGGGGHGDLGIHLHRRKKMMMRSGEEEDDRKQESKQKQDENEDRSP